MIGDAKQALQFWWKAIKTQTGDDNNVYKQTKYQWFLQQAILLPRAKKLKWWDGERGIKKSMKNHDVIYG